MQVGISSINLLCFTSIICSYLTQYDCVTFYSYLESVKYVFIVTSLVYIVGVSTCYSCSVFMYCRSSNESRAFTSNSSWAFMDATNMLFVVCIIIFIGGMARCLTSTIFIGSLASSPWCPIFSIQKARERVYGTKLPEPKQAKATR